MTADTAVVELQDVTVEFPGVKALDGVDFRLLPGEIHARADAKNSDVVDRFF